MTNPMDGCNRCPKCHLVPQPNTVGDIWSLECEHPGENYIAYGDSLPKAIVHWNVYVHFRETERAA